MGQTWLRTSYSNKVDSRNTILNIFVNQPSTCESLGEFSVQVVAQLSSPNAFSQFSVVQFSHLKSRIQTEFRSFFAGYLLPFQSIRQC
jgi:hypothetical protein